MLLGDVNSYGKTLEEPMSFAELLREVEKVEGLEIIRFMTPHPKDLSDDLIEVMARSKKVCKYICTSSNAVRKQPSVKIDESSLYKRTVCGTC